MICDVHKTNMHLRQGQYGDFWSCPQKDQYGNWCRWKPPRVQAGPPQAPPLKPTNNNGKSEEEQKNIRRQVSLYAAVDFIGHLKPVDTENELMRLAQKFYEWLTPSAQKPTPPAPRPILPGSTLPPPTANFSRISKVLPPAYLDGFELGFEQDNYEQAPF